MNNTLREFSKIAASKSWRLTLRLSRWLLIICVAIIAGFTLYAVNMLPPLQPWHTERLSGEFSALTDSNLDFEGYLKLENNLFKQLDEEIATWDQTSEAFVYSRFNSSGLLNALVEGAPYNHSFRLELAKPIGHALLIQGLTDSPYSMKALAEILHTRGFEVTVLRLPGHGTLPSMMTEMRLRDWTAVVRIAARNVAARSPVGQPFYIGGYSTGGTLALQYTLDALDDSSLRRPDRVLLISPAIQLTKVATLAGIIDVMSIIPIPVLEKVRWQEVVAEYDPYKFNSFPVNAARQVNRATKALQTSLIDAVESGHIAQLPPVITWQSVVDSTVGTTGAVDVLYPALKGTKHRIVLFDVNRLRAFGSVQRSEPMALIKHIKQSRRAYTLDLVSNINPQSHRVSVTRTMPNNSQSIRDTGLDWPQDLVSVGHVSLPFPANDPVYGFMPGSGRNGIPSIGSWLFRGESGAISISLGSLTRLRSNPFWPLIDQDIAAFVAEDTAPKP